MSLPNVLWIFSDQHRAHALGCAGDPNVETPNLDRLATEGMRFTSAYSNTPLCAPFRANLYTGQYITTHGVISLHRPLLPMQPELPEVLRRHGYHTCHHGKWHLAGGAGPTHFVSPYFRPGWDVWQGWENSNEPFRTMYAAGPGPGPFRWFDGYQTDCLTDLTLEWLDALPDDQPWFHVMSIEPPHPPNQAPEPYMAMYADRALDFRENFDHENEHTERFKEVLRGYYAQIRNLDDNVGRVLQKLEDMDQLDNTVVMYFSDHGDLMGSHGRLGKSRPEEESSCIPLLVRYPELVPGGTVSDALISAVDFMPTLLGVLGLPIPDGVEGEDLSRVLRDPKEAGADSVLLQYESTFFPATPDSVFRTIRLGNWKYTCYLTQGPCQLFNLASDPYEMDNRIDDPAAAGQREKLHAALAQKLEQLGDEFPAREMGNCNE